jgi:hypothetical protein
MAAGDDADLTRFAFDLRARPHPRALNGDRPQPRQVQRALYLNRLARLYPGRRTWIRHSRRMAEPRRDCKRPCADSVLLRRREGPRTERLRTAG